MKPDPTMARERWIPRLRENDKQQENSTGYEIASPPVSLEVRVLFGMVSQ